jgi:type VI protein secretion system component Hcp
MAITLIVVSLAVGYENGYVAITSVALRGDGIMSKKSEDQPVELNDQQLDKIAGGTKTTDKASPNLFNSTSTGTHIKEAKIT